MVKRIKLPKSSSVDRETLLQMSPVNPEKLCGLRAKLPLVYDEDCFDPSWFKDKTVSGNEKGE